MKERIRSRGACVGCGAETSAPTAARCWSCHTASRSAGRSRCLADLCEQVADANALCTKHLQRWRDGFMDHPDGRVLNRPICTVDECDRPIRGRGLCSRHWQRWRIYGDPVAPKIRHGNGWLNEDGYRVVHRDGRDILEHRHLFQQVLGRPLLETEQVHHVNTVRTDNRVDGPPDSEFRSGNLQLWTTSHPAGGRAVDMVAYAVELLELYAPELLADRPVQLKLVN